MKLSLESNVNDIRNNKNDIFLISLGVFRDKKKKMLFFYFEKLKFVILFLKNFPNKRIIRDRGFRNSREKKGISMRFYIELKFN